MAANLFNNLVSSNTYLHLPYLPQPTTDLGEKYNILYNNARSVTFAHGRLRQRSIYDNNCCFIGRFRAGGGGLITKLSTPE